MSETPSPPGEAEGTVDFVHDFPPDATLAASPPGSAPRANPPADLAQHPRYRLTRLLGQGGMGAVWQATHLLMDRPVALKVIHHQFTADEVAVERFRREVRAAARLQHPHIVTAYDA